VVPTVRDVEDDAAPAGGVHGVLHAAAGVEDSRAAAVEEVAHDVPRPEQRQHVAVLRGRVVDVHDHRDPGRLGGPEPPAKRLETVLGHHLGLDPHLHAEDDVSVVAGDAGGQVGIRVLEVAVLADREVREPDRGDVEEPEHTGVRARHHVLAEPGEVRRAGAPRVAKRGHAGGAAHRVGLDSQVVAGDERVRVKVDQARRDVRARDVDHLPRGIARDRGVDGRHAPGGEGHVAATVDTPGGVEHVAADEQEVMAHSDRPPRAARGDAARTQAR
jgi:hypothetical protein